MALKRISSKSKTIRKIKPFNTSDAYKFIAKIRKELRMVGAIPGVNCHSKK